MVMSDRIALLRSGELEQVATPRDIYSRPATSYVAQFIGHTNLLKADIMNGIAHCGILSWRTSEKDGKALFSLRPENIRLASGAADFARFRAAVSDQAFHGATELLRLNCNGQMITARAASGAVPSGEMDFEFTPSDAVRVRPSEERL